MSLSDTEAATRIWTNNNGTVGNNVWTVLTNWSPNNVPTIADTARISGGVGSAILLRDGTAGSVDCGTLLFENTGYDAIRTNANLGIEKGSLLIINE